MTASPRVEVAFGLGSNVGDKRLNIHRALDALMATGLVDGPSLSSLYRTPPWGPVEQDWYVNACAVGATGLKPEDLLTRVKALEVALGRIEAIRWGPRLIDIDILYFGDLSLETPRLTLPHRDLLNRAFVLVPLAELRPERRIGERTIGEAALACDRTGMTRLD